MTEEKCYQCGSDIEVKTVGEYKDLVCEQCGIVVDSQIVVENQEPEGVDEEKYEVVE